MRIFLCFFVEILLCLSLLNAIISMCMKCTENICIIMLESRLIHHEYHQAFPVLL